MTIARLVIAAFLLTLPLSAQTIDPNYLQFIASPDHFAVTASGQPLVVGYRMDWYRSGEPAPFQSSDLAKPVPDAQSTILLSLQALSPILPPPNITYVAHLLAYGPSGVSSEALSNAFQFSGPCSFTVSPSSFSVPSGIVQLVTNLITTAACGWTTTPNAPWLTVIPPSGVGSGPVTIGVAANTGALRFGSVTIGSVIVAVTQAAAPTPPPPCTLTVLVPISGVLPSSASSASVTLSIGATCAWTAKSSASWLTVTPAAGTGAASLTYKATRNDYGQSKTRSATLTIAGVSFPVVQAGRR